MSDELALNFICLRAKKHLRDHGMSIPYALVWRQFVSLKAAPDWDRPPDWVAPPDPPRELSETEERARAESLPEWIPDGSLLPVPSGQVYSWRDMSVQLTDVFACLLANKQLDSHKRMVPRLLLLLMCRAGSQAPELSADRRRWKRLLAKIERDKRVFVEPLPG